MCAGDTDKINPHGGWSCSPSFSTLGSEPAAQPGSPCGVWAWEGMNPRAARLWDHGSHLAFLHRLIWKVGNHKSIISQGDQMSGGACKVLRQGA